MPPTQEVKERYEEFHSKDPRRSEFFKANNRYQFLAQLMKNAEGRVLVVGCGSSHEMSVLNEKCEGIGIDISEVAIQKTKKLYPQYEYVVGDAMDMDFESKSMDYIICSEVIEHLPDDKKFITSANRILKDDGVLIITTPNWISTWGLARKLGELVLRHPVTSGNQPIDHWYTYGQLRSVVGKHFQIKKNWGLWYLPPFGLGKVRLPDPIEYPIFRAFQPLEKVLRHLIPTLGHCHAIYAVKKK